MAQSISLVLPYPVSVNAAYRNVAKRGRVKTAAYTSWETEAAWKAREQAQGRISGPYAFHMRVQRPDRRARDLGNLEKVTHDLCVSLGIVEDDSLCQRILLEWSDEPPAKNAQVKVWLIATGER
jgi:crossover junction endodeoxyribonuclease RusA